MNDRQQVRLAVIAGLVLYVALPPKLTIGPVWVAPLAVGLFLLPVIALAPRGIRTGRLIRILSISSIFALNFFNVTSVVLLLNVLLNKNAPGHSGVTAFELLRYGSQIWTTNVIVFALWFWELDSKGPFYREDCKSARDFDDPDFLFPQMVADDSRIRGIPHNWKPRFLDYVYVSFTNALAVSPTDTMPLTRTAKMLMLVESLISFVTVALILARSVNILP